MAHISVGSGFGVDMTAFDFSSLYYGMSYTRSSVFYAVAYANGAVDEFRGQDFRYDGNGVPIGGMVKSYGLSVDGARAFIVDGIRVAATGIVKAAESFGTADDRRLIAGALTGNDRISGGQMEDILYAYGGNDRITGGGDADLLFGGKGADLFVYRSIADSTAGQSDRIGDFRQAEKDRIDLSALDANAAVDGNQRFRFAGEEGLIGKAGQVAYDHEDGDTFILADRDGDGAADIVIRIEADIDLRAQDFVL